LTSSFSVSDVAAKSGELKSNKRIKAATFCDLAVLSSFALLLGVSLASVGQVKVKDRLV